MNKITVEISISKNMDVEVDIDDVLFEINELPLVNRINYVAHLINKIDVESGELNKDHKEKVVDWLNKQIKRFES